MADVRLFLLDCWTQSLLVRRFKAKYVTFRDYFICFNSILFYILGSSAGG